jgi:DNA-binding NarL/FixJ family response regulator
MVKFSASHGHFLQEVGLLSGISGRERWREKSLVLPAFACSWLFCALMEQARRASAAEMVTLAYDLSFDFPSWFVEAVSTFRTHLDDGFGIYGAIARREPPKLLYLHLDGAHPLNRVLCALGPSVGMYRRLPHGFSAGTASEVLGQTVNARAVAPFLSVLRAPDSCGLSGPDGAGLVLAFAAPRGKVAGPRLSEQRLAQSVLPHFAAALRLRRSLSGLAFDTESAEAVFDSHGRCTNAQGMAEPNSMRKLLSEAILERERARAHPADDDEQPRDALLAGRWSLVDRYDSDGRRFIVGYRNPPGVLDPRRLSPRERDVASRIARGMSQTAVAAELGVSASTVASVATGVVKKLGLRSTRELPLFWRDTSGQAVALGRDDLFGVCSADHVPAPKLTPAERDVLEGLTRGLSNREIADRRRSSLRTVANQVARLLRKHGASSRVELAARKLDAAE